MTGGSPCWLLCETGNGGAADNDVDSIVEDPDGTYTITLDRPITAGELTTITYTTDTPLGNTYVTINENGNDQPFEVFIQTSKAGSDTAAVSEAIGRLISYVLRLSSPVLPGERMRDVIRQLSGIGGGRPMGFGSNRVLSLPDGVAQALNDYLAESVLPATEANGHMPQQAAGLPFGDLCPECGEASVVNEEGCRKCYSCGFSEC